MKTILAIILCLVATAIPAADWTGLCVAVTDGDTIRVLSPDRREVRVRLYDIDAPERRQPYGTVSRDYIASLCHRREVTVRIVDTDRYGRVVALVEVISSHKDVNRALVEAGLAWVYPHYCRIPVCGEWRRLETEARRARIGLWGGSDPPVPPWEWRLERKQ